MLFVPLSCMYLRSISFACTSRYCPSSASILASIFDLLPFTSTRSMPVGVPLRSFGEPRERVPQPSGYLLVHHTTYWTHPVVWLTRQPLRLTIPVESNYPDLTAKTSEFAETDCLLYNVIVKRTTWRLFWAIEVKNEPNFGVHAWVNDFLPFPVGN